MADLKIGHYTRKKTKDRGLNAPLHMQFGWGGKTRGARAFASLEMTTTVYLERWF